MKTYALLVGLDQYQESRIPPLHGCVNDVSRFEEYLKKTLNVPKEQILKLSDKTATKAAVVGGFQKHLAQATNSDVAIFYFAGHGIRQYANDVFKAATLNDTFECMTCYDTTLAGGNLIADKELRWLINQLAEKTNDCHILTIFDCCHSGDNTRAIANSTKAALTPRFVADPNQRGREFIMPARTWKEFVFSPKIAEKDFVGKDVDEVLPQGSHIQLAACASNETAKEKDGRGLFSKYLLELLESSGSKMSYYDLRSLTYRRLSTFPPENRQTPQFYAVKNSLFQPFLGGATETGVEANVVFNTDKNQWEMSMGSIYGIPKGAKVFVTLPHKNNEVEAAVVKDVFQDFSVLSFDIEAYEADTKLEDKRIRRTDTYECVVGAFMQKEIKVASVSNTIADAWGQYAKSRADLLKNALVKPVNASEQPDYVLNTEKNKVFVADPLYPARPLVKMIDIDTKDANKAFDALVAQFAFLTRWNFVKAQKNEPTADKLFEKTQITIQLGDKTTNLNPSNKLVFPITGYSKDGDSYVSNDIFGIKIINNHPTDTIYVSGMWLSEYFGISCTILNNSSIAMPLEPTKAFEVYGTPFSVSFQDNILADKWDKLTNYLKIYVSNAPFDITQFEQADLERPRKGANRGGEIIGERGGPRAPSVPISMPQWAVKTIEIELKF